MFLLYSSTSSLVCIEVSVGACLTWGAAADNYLPQNGIIVSSTVQPHRHIRVCLTSIKIFFLSVTELGAVSIVALCCWSSRVEIHFSPIYGVDSQLGLPIFPCKMLWIAATKGILFSQALQHCWEQREERVEEGREKAKKKKAAPCVFVKL